MSSRITVSNKPLVNTCRAAVMKVTCSSYMIILWVIGNNL